MTIQLISGIGFFSINGTQYPVGEYRVVIHGDNIGLAEVGSQGYVYAVNPEFYGNWDDETGTPYATKQDLLDDLEAILFTVGDSGCLNGTVCVNSLGDFPTPVAGVITLNSPNTVYSIIESVDIGANRFVLAADNIKICGTTSIRDSISSTTTGVLFESTGFTLILQDFTIVAATSSKICQIIDTDVKTFAMIRMVIVAATSLGTFDTLKVLDVRDCFFTGFTSGFTLNGLFEAIIFKTSLIEGFTGIFLDLNGCTSNAINISENSSILQPGATFLEIEPLGANIVLGGEGTIFGNKINIIAGGTPIVGYTSFEPQWGVELNDKILTSDRAFPTGWGFYVDGGAAPASQVLTSTYQKLLIDGLGVNSEEGYLPNSIKGIASLWDTTNDKIIGITEGDSYNLRLDIHVDSDSGNPAYIEFELDIGGLATPSIIIVDRIISIPKVPPFELSLSFSFFTLATFIANGGQIFLKVDTGTVTITTRQILLTRTSSGAT